MLSRSMDVRSGNEGEKRDIRTITACCRSQDEAITDRGQAYFFCRPIHAPHSWMHEWIETMRTIASIAAVNHAVDEINPIGGKMQISGGVLPTSCSEPHQANGATVEDDGYRSLMERSHDRGKQCEPMKGRGQGNSWHLFDAIRSKFVIETRSTDSE